MNNPLISLILATKNSLPHLKSAIQSIRQQTYTDFELIVQDGGSTDGTLEYLQSIDDLPRIEIVSEPDYGIGQAYNRGINRCKGDFICFTASDERLFDHSLEMALSWFKQFPSAAVIYGGVVIVDKQGKHLSTFIPEQYDFLEVMKCNIVPPIAGLFNRKVIGSDLYYDETVKTCPDYDFWLRLGSRFSHDQIINRSELFMTSLGDETSMSYRPAAFEQFCKDKSFILDRFLSGPSGQITLEILKKKAKSNIFLWAANRVFSIDNDSPIAAALCKKANELDPGSKRMKQIMDHWCITPQIMNPKTLGIPEHAKVVKNALSLNSFISDPIWGAKLSFHTKKQDRVFRSHLARKLFFRINKKTKLRHFFNILVQKLVNTLCIKGGVEPWGYIAQAQLNDLFSPNPQMSYWIRIRIKVQNGTIGLCFMDNEMIKNEELFQASQETVLSYFPLHNFSNFSIMLRNAGNSKTTAEIIELSLIEASHYDVFATSEREGHKNGKC